MRKSRPTATVAQLDARLREQSLDVVHLRRALDAQMNRIGQMHLRLFTDRSTRVIASKPLSHAPGAWLKGVVTFVA